MSEVIKFCEVCEEDTVHDVIYDPPSLWIHAILTIITLGVYLPFYLLFTLFTWNKITDSCPYCSQCGSSNY